MKLEEIKRREKELREKEIKIASAVSNKKRAVFERFPLVFTLLGSFGLVATFYGFEKLIDKIDYFSDKPFTLLLFGILLLILTGSLYKKLQ